MAAEAEGGGIERRALREQFACAADAAGLERDDNHEHVSVGGTGEGEQELGDLGEESDAERRDLHRRLARPLEEKRRVPVQPFVRPATDPNL